MQCILDENHEGSCMPQLPALRALAMPALTWAAAREPEFIAHLLAVVESAGDTLTFLEALNIARALCRTRLGIPDRRL
jgi:hypothetical protein